MEYGCLDRNRQSKHDLQLLSEKEAGFGILYKCRATNASKACVCVPDLCNNGIPNTWQPRGQDGRSGAGALLLLRQEERIPPPVTVVPAWSIQILHSLFSSHCI